jgi:Tol biopolymer transport system component/predicted Ser/Thr protein kinase
VTQSQDPDLDKAAYLYQLALERDESQRAAFLQDACAGDAGRGDSAGTPSGTASRSGNAAPPPRPSVGPRQIAHYEIVARLGAGGMGEVFRARDLRLGRDVAIKVMHRGLSSNPDRRRRFEREAQAAAQLNHPNIATIYEIGDDEGTPFIAMELVEGRTLRELLRRGALQVHLVLRLASQVAGALAKAHAAGIVHRDLKPGNLMVTDDGLAKILDFGLVKLLPTSSDPDSEITGEGAVVGTVDYMSPEQAVAGPVDHRSDQFSFGSILYEMITGQRPFKRGTAAQTLVAIVRDAPDPVRKLRADAPRGLAAIVERCLAKDPAKRYATTSALAAEVALAEAANRSLPSEPSSRPRRVALTLALVAVGAIAGLSWLASRGRAPEGGDLPLAVPLTSYPGREADPSFSPDGSQVVFTWNGERQSNQDIYVKVIGAENPLRLTSDPAVDGSPAWSPDGSQIAFLRERPGGGSQVRLIPPTGGAERPVAEVAASPEYGLAWSPDGRRLAAVDRSSPGTPLQIVVLDTETGAKVPLTSPTSIAGRGDAWPAFSPDGRTVAFKRSMAPTAHYVCVVPSTGGEPRQLAPTTPVTSPLAWMPDGREIVFTALALTGGGSQALSTRANTGAPPVLWRMPLRGGPASPLAGSTNAYGVAVSREGHRLAFTQQTSDWDVWRVDLRASAADAPIRLIASTRFDGNAQFSPDGTRVAFTSARSGSLEIWIVDEDGGHPQRLTFLGRTGSVGSPRWSPDGAQIAFDYVAEGDTGADVLVVSASGGQPRRVTTSPAPDVRPCWSRDGRFLYFGSHRSGEWQVWKVPVEGETVGSAGQVTRGGGYAAIESPDGEYLYFSRRLSLPEDPENSIWRVPVHGGEEQVVIESLHSSDTNWDVTPRGIYFVDRPAHASPDEERWAIRFLDLGSHRESVVSTLRYPPRLSGPALSVSRDGRWLLVSQLQEESDLMLVEGFR